MSGPALKRRYTYDDLASFPDDNLRRELIDGELIVTPSPRFRHQVVLTELLFALVTWTKQHGGRAVPARTDVRFSDETVLEPDVLLVRAEHYDRIEEKYVSAAPDLVAEVSSPSTRHLDRVRKRAVYERFGVPEYWFVDLDSDCVEVHRLVDGRYPEPQVLTLGDTLTSAQLPGFSLVVRDLLHP
jgi:Uma2 family endonuclease